VTSHIAGIRGHEYTIVVVLNLLIRRPRLTPENAAYKP
jgi:hypothetical protein